MPQSAAVDGHETTTFSGRRFTRVQLRQLIETVETFQNLSLKELALTICEHLFLRTHNGSLKVLSCITLLEKLEALGLVTLPAKRVTKKPQPRRVAVTAASAPKPDVHGTLHDVGEIELKLVSSREDRSLFNEHLERHHYLGYRQPIGQSLRYFVVAKERDEEKLGCLLFAPGSYAMKARDEWIGWKTHHKLKRLHLVISNKRFLIFPWVRIPNLASKTLSLIPNQIAADWERSYGSRPVLIETFVDPSKNQGTCYQAANWQRIGQTNPISGYKDSRAPGGSPKDIYVFPLASDFRDVLKGGKIQRHLTNMAAALTRLSPAEEAFGKMGSVWAKIMGMVREITRQFDGAWQQRKRVIDSMMLVMLIFRLVSGKDRKGYGTTIDELWENCRKMKISLPQPEGIAASSFSKARGKLCESIFIHINERLLAIYDAECHDSDLWHGHRIFAVDGSKLNLPRELLALGYGLPTPISYRPQGLASCLYRLKSAMPYDFGLYKHKDERLCAIEHLSKLTPGDVVVYDRGYFSYVMLHRHQQAGVHVIFRLTKNTYEPIRNFWTSDAAEAVVTILPEGQHLKNLERNYPDIQFEPISLRLIKYHIAGEAYCLGTTLFEQSISPPDFQDVYHARWGIEELYKISKHIFDVEQFHGRSERGAKQEVYAHFALITINRIVAHHADKTRRDLHAQQSTDMPTITPNRTNFKNAVCAFFRNMESLFAGGAMCCFDGVVNWVKSSVRRFQKVRPGRAYPRQSMKPINKWQAATKKKMGAAALS